MCVKLQVFGGLATGNICLFYANVLKVRGQSCSDAANGSSWTFGQNDRNGRKLTNQLGPFEARLVSRRARRAR